jgi:hypothetical protein
VQCPSVVILPRLILVIYLISFQKKKKQRAKRLTESKERSGLRFVMCMFWGGGWWWCWWWEGLC